MITLIVGNKETRLDGLDKRAKRELDKLTSYRVEGFMFAPSFKAKRWDGCEHLLTFSKKHGYRAPSGLIAELARRLRRLGMAFRVELRTVVRGKKKDYGFELPLRDYQQRAIDEVLKPPFKGRGILKMPIRSGKTRTAAGLINRLGLPTMFLVPSIGLLHQTHAALSEALPRQRIGVIGDGVYDVQRVTVATLQTLSRMRGARKNGDKAARPQDPRYTALISYFDLIICDEVHHLRGSGGNWYKTANDFDARYKVGLSATAFVNSKVEQSRGAIWMLATCGPVRVEITTAEMVKAGFLMQQNLHCYEVTKPNMNGYGWSSTLYDRCIAKNPARNRLIARIVQAHVKKGRRVLVIAKRKAHLAALAHAIDARGVAVEVVHGGTPAARREELKTDLAARNIDALVGNVMGEGIDLPELEVVINAEGGKDDKVTVQRQRNLTKAKGKKCAIVVDFLDLTNEKLEEHSRARLEMYKGEGSKVKMC